MAVTFKTPLPNVSTPKVDTGAAIFRRVLTGAGVSLPKEAQVFVGVTSSTIIMPGGVSLTFPFGVAALANGDPAIGKAVAHIVAVFGAGGSPAPSVGTDGDEAWASALCDTVFPTVIPLSTATALYQPVRGTSSKAVYRTAFLGDDLRGACRILDNKMSLRFTTTGGKAPVGGARDALLRLGVNGVSDDRITVHALMPGTFQEAEPFYSMAFGAYYAVLRPYLTSGYPDIAQFTKGVS